MYTKVENVKSQRKEMSRLCADYVPVPIHTAKRQASPASQTLQTLLW